MNVAVVHDGCLETPGGAATVSVELARVLDADLYVGRTDCRDWYRDRAPRDLTVYAGVANRLPRMFRDALVAYRTGKLHLPEYDVVVTSGVPAKFYQPGSFQRHVHYTHHPPLWYAQWLSRDELDGVVGNLRYGLRKLGMYSDWLEMQRVESIVANSPTTAERVRRHYGRSATVVQPPVELSDAPVLGVSDRDDFLLYAGRLGERKRLETLVRAVGRTDARLVVTGDGPMRSALERLATSVGADVEFRGFVPEEELDDLMRRARAGVFLAAEEDFGMTVAELLCWGTPVIVADEPNPSRMVDDDSGVRVDPTVEAVAAAIDQFDSTAYDTEHIAADARDRYGTDRFEAGIRRVVLEETDHREPD